MHVQAEADKPFFANTVEQSNDHARCLHSLAQAIATIPHIVTEANANGERISKLSVAVVDNNANIKRGLKELETIFTAQGTAVPELRNDVQGAVRDIANFVR